MKYVGEDEKVRMLIVERHPFKRFANYFTDSLFYQDSLEAYENPHPEDHDSGNEADTEPKPEEECLQELNPPVTSVDKLDFNNTVNVEGKWFINENLDLAYLSALASDSVPLDTSIYVDSYSLSTIDALNHCMQQ